MPIISGEGGGGGTPFNGGTITTPLIIAPTDPAAVALKLTPAAGATAAFTDVLEVYDDANNLMDYFDAAGEGGVEIKSGSGGAWAVRSAGSNVLLVDEGNTRVRMQLPAGWVFNVVSSAGTIFEVRGDGSLHGLTGKSLTFDL